MVFFPVFRVLSVAERKGRPSCCCCCKSTKTILPPFFFPSPPSLFFIFKSREREKWLFLGDYCLPACLLAYLAKTTFVYLEHRIRIVLLNTQRNRKAQKETQRKINRIKRFSPPSPCFFFCSQGKPDSCFLRVWAKPRIDFIGFCYFHPALQSLCRF